MWLRLVAVLAAVGAALIILPLPTFDTWKLHYAALELSALPAALGLIALWRGRGRLRLVGLVAALVGLAPITSGLILFGQRHHTFSVLGYLGLDPAPDISPRLDLVLEPGRPDLTLDLYPGVGDGPRPWVAVMHGGSWAHGAKGEVSHVSRSLAGAGYTVFDLNYRLSEEAPFPAGVSDIKCLLGRIVEQAATLGVDPARGAVMGRSAGGHMALLIGASAGDPRLAPACAVADYRPWKVIALYPTADLAWGWANVPTPDLIDSQQVLSTYLGGSPQDQPDNYAAATPMSWLDSGDPPALLIHGLGDRMVSPHHDLAYATAAEAVGVSATVIQIPFADHGFDLRRGGLAEQLARAEILQFLQ